MYALTVPAGPRAAAFGCLPWAVLAACAELAGAFVAEDDRPAAPGAAPLPPSKAKAPAARPRTTTATAAAASSLVSEGDSVEKAINEENPDAVAISISKEELVALGNKDDYDKYEPSDIEEIYGVLLETFGDVKIPPPCYVKARDVGTSKNITLVPIDMNESSTQRRTAMRSEGWT